MPYIVPAGTPVRVIKPNGKVVETYICRRHTSFADGQVRRHGSHYLEFRHDGWQLILAESGGIKIGVKCE